PLGTQTDVASLRSCRPPVARHAPGSGHGRARRPCVAICPAGRWTITHGRRVRGVVIRAAAAPGSEGLRTRLAHLGSLTYHPGLASSVGGPLGPAVPGGKLALGFRRTRSAKLRLNS